MILDKIFKNEKGEYISFIDFIFGSTNSKEYIYTLAEAHAIDLIAKTISKCEIQTFETKGEKIPKVKGDLYWTLNLQPNLIENGTKFLYKLVVKLLEDKTALIIINKKAKSNLLYVADSYNASNDIFYGKTFTDVVVSDDEGNSLKVNKPFNSNNSIYFSLKNDKLTSSSENFKTNSGKILKAAQKNFVSGNTPKWRLKIPGNQPKMLDPTTNEPMDYTKYKEKITEGINSEEEAIVMLSEQFDLLNLNKDNNKKIDDYSSTIKTIGDAVAQKWNIPLDIFYGSKTEKSTGNNDFITFAVSPYFELLEDGFNIALVGKDDYLKGEYIRFNKFNITHKDIIESANGIDKLTADGFSRNEINELLGLPRIDEAWADEHNLTKNYANVKGGAK